MKKILLIFTLLIGFAGYSQVKQTYAQYGGKWKRIQPDSAFKIPMVQVGVKDYNAGYDTAQLYYNPVDSSVYVYTGFAWRALVSGSGSIDSLIYSTRAWRQKGDDSLGAVIAARTLQQVLTAGSTLTTDNKVTLNNNVFSIVKSGTDTMFLIDPVNLKYKFGDFSGVGNATSIKIDDNTNVISLDGILRVQGFRDYNFLANNYPVYWNQGNLEYTAGWSVDSVWRDSDSIKYRVLGPSPKGGTFGIYAPTSGSSYTFSNGLTEAAGAVKLGGTLTENTDIEIGSNVFSIGGVSNVGFSMRESGLLQITGDTLTLSSGSKFLIPALPYTLSTTGKKIMLRDTASGLVQNIDPALLGFGATGTLATFGAGAGLSTDTAAFQLTSIYGSFFWDGTDTLVVTKSCVTLQGTSANIDYDIYFNDSLNVTAGASTVLSSINITSTTTAYCTDEGFITTKIPPGNWVWVKTSTLTTKPTYFSLSLIGYKKRVI